MDHVSSERPYRYCLEQRALVLCTGFVMLLTGISLRLIHLQHTEHEEAKASLKDDWRRIEPIPSRRGDILDRHQRPLATTQPVSRLLLDRFQIPVRETIHQLAVDHLGMSLEDLSENRKEDDENLYYQLLAQRLERPLKMTQEELLERFHANSPNPRIHQGVDSQLAREIVKTLEAEDFYGVHYRDATDRVYINESLACHVLGYVNYAMAGVAGIEQSMDMFLQGEDGYLAFDRHKVLHAEKLPTHGKHVVLTIDSAFQGMVEKVMDSHFQSLTPHAMTAIFAEPSTGEILALVNRPGFQSAEGANAKPSTPWKTVDPKWNTAVSSVYEPGSTFKIVTHGAAIDQGLVGLDSWVSCHDGYYMEEGWKGALEDSAEGRPSASVRDVLAFSLNTGTFMVAQQLNANRFRDYMERFGLGTDTGIRLPAEESGSLVSAAQIRDRFTLSRVGMGYNLNTTPLQVLSLMNVLCNDGNLVKPRIVRQILAEDYASVSAELDSEVMEGVIASRTARTLRRALVHAVEHGTGKDAAVEGYIVGGKTGTAMKSIRGHYYKGRNLASFVGFIGQDVDAPALIGMVLVDEPRNKGKRHGGNIAGPIFKEIAEAGMYHYGIRRLEVAGEVTDN